MYDELTAEREKSISINMPGLMKDVYAWMAIALVVTGFSAWFPYVSNSIDISVQQLSNHNKFSPQLHPLCFSLFSFYHKLTINHHFFDIFSFPPL